MKSNPKLQFWPNSHVFQCYCQSEQQHKRDTSTFHPMIHPVMAVLARLRSACILWYQAPVKYTKSECLHSCSPSTARAPKQRREGGGGDGRWQTRQKCKSRQRWLVTSSLRLAAALRTAVQREASSSQATLMTIQDKSVFSIQILMHYKQCRDALFVCLGIFFVLQLSCGLELFVCCSFHTLSRMGCVCVCVSFDSIIKITVKEKLNAS